MKDQYKTPDKTLLLHCDLHHCCYGYSYSLLPRSSFLVELFLIMFQGLAISHEWSLSIHGFAGCTVSVPNLVPWFKECQDYSLF